MDQQVRTMCLDGTEIKGEDGSAILSLRDVEAVWDDKCNRYSWQKSGSGLAVSLPFGRFELNAVTESEPLTCLRVAATLVVTQPVRLHSLELRYSTGFGRYDQATVPHLRPAADLVIADQVFRSPAVVARKGRQVVALVPDLSTITPAHKTYLDVQREGQGEKSLLAHGLGEWTACGHVFFKRTRSKRTLQPGTEVPLVHFVLSFPDVEELPLEKVASFLWRRFAPRDAIVPQVLPLLEYDKLAAERAFGEDLFRRFTYQNRPMAGLIAQTTTSKKRPNVLDARGTIKYIAQQKYVMAVMHAIQEHLFTKRWGNDLLTKILHSGRFAIPPMAVFAAWFNQVRTSLGTALYAQRAGDRDLLEKTHAVVELALSSPMEDGCPWTLCFFPADGEVFWRRGTRAFEVTDAYNLADASVTGFHLLEWHEMVHADERILKRCQILARFLLGFQDPSGAFPTWVKPLEGRFEIDPDLSRSAMTAAPAMFLARLHRVTPNKEYTAAVSKALQFIEREVLPEEKWFDFELFYSCAGRPTGKDGPDPYTGCYPANTLSMYWAAQAALDLHKTGKQPEALTMARRYLARVSMFQQVWDTPRLSINTLGGFGVMNADAEFNDARQGLFAPLYLATYRATGEAEFFERGVAALRSCYTTMLCEANHAVAPGNMIFYRDLDCGSILENYGHQGWDAITSGYLSPDWGCATALYASGLTFRHHGQIFVDVTRRQAFGIDGCQARFVSAKGKNATIEVSGPIETELVVVVEPAGAVNKLLVNGEEATAGEAGRFVVPRRKR